MPPERSQAPSPDGTLRERLARTGSLGVAELFAAEGVVERYYARGRALGADGDFVTAPEISQMFGELLGLWLVDAWQRQGAPAPFVLAELGPGNGTLMRDLWRAVAVVPAFRTAAQVHLVERSQALRERQTANLANVDHVHHDDIETLPAGPLLLIANEFLDALPAHQLVRTAAGWAERCIVLDHGAPSWSTRPAPAALVARACAMAGHAPTGTIVEPAPAREAMVGTIAARIARWGGAALLVDYGALEPATVDTLQAVRGHAPVDVLTHLATADLTMAVAFGPLRAAAAAAGAQAFGPLPQARVLRALGLELRAMQLGANLDTDARRLLFAGARRLLDPRAMGELYKMLAVLPAGAAAPAGFSAEDDDRSIEAAGEQVTGEQVTGEQEKSR